MTIQIFWNDLTRAKQNEIIAAYGGSGNFDVCPIAELEVEDSEYVDKRLQIAYHILFEQIIGASGLAYYHLTVAELRAAQDTYYELGSSGEAFTFLDGVAKFYEKFCGYDVELVGSNYLIH